MYKNQAARRPLNAINDQNLRERERERERELIVCKADTHAYIPSVLVRVVSYGDPPVVGNAEVILGLVQLGLQAVHTGDGQHELRGVRPHLPWEERGRERERRCQAKKLVQL